VSPRVKLCAFGLLLAVMFLAARAAGLSLGPVTTSYSRGGTSANTGGGLPGMPGMNMFPSSRNSDGSRPARPAPAARPGYAAPRGKEPR
jgi:hypothetical protein